MAAVDASPGGMANMPDWAVVVAAIPHSDTCSSETAASEDCPANHVLSCDCDRDPRIARGIEAAVSVSWQYGLLAEHDLEYQKAVLQTFIRAAGLTDGRPWWSEGTR